VAVGFGPDDQIVVCRNTSEGFETRTFDPGGGSAGPVFALPGAAGASDPGRVTQFVPVPGRDWVLATTDAAGDVLFDPATGKVVTGWPDPRSGDPTVAAPSPDGKLIAFGTLLTPVKLWNARTQKAGRPLEGSAGVAALAFTPDGQKLVGLWPHGRLRVWDPATGRFLAEVDHHHAGKFAGLAAIADSVVVLGPASGRLLLNLDTGKALNTGDGPDPLAGRGFVVPARGWVFAADREGHLTSWSVNPDRARRLPAKPAGPSPWPDVRVLRDAPASPPVGLAFAADGKAVLVATEDGKLARYTADRLLLEREVVADEAPLYGLARAGDTVFTLGRRSLVTARDAATLERRFEIPSQAAGSAVPILLAAAPDGSTVVVSADKARLADVKARKELTTAALPRPAVGKHLTQFAPSADGRLCVGRWGDAITAVWNPKTGQPRVLEELAEAVPASPQGLAVTPNGKVAFLGTGDGKLTAWDTATGDVLFNEAVYPDAGAGEAVAAVAVLPDGARFLTAGRGGRVILWELDGFRKAKEFRTPDGPWRLVVAPDGKAVVMQKPEQVLRIDLP
jgi:WD40 repeat protein